MAKFLVDYIYGYLPDIKENSVILEATFSEEPDYKEVNEVFKPLILRNTGHSEVKIMSYKEID